jgi:EmrB/QacA subfamily drug resistance transporter
MAVRAPLRRRRPVSDLARLPPADARRRLTLAATVLGSSLAFIDASVVIVALPTIQRDLDLGLTGQQWVFLSYSLALAALYLVAGAVGDRAGRRETFVAGIIGFALASVLAGVAADGVVLIVARTLQGVAGAFLTVNSLALLREVYGAEAGRAVGLWTAFTGVATIAGPPVGGAVVEWASWRWIFFLNLPLSAVAIALAARGRDCHRMEQRLGHLDVSGALLAATGLGALTYGIVEGGERGFADYWWVFLVAAGALGAFLARERSAAEPMLPLALFRRRNFAVANLETLSVYAALGGFLFFFTLYLQFLGFSPFEAGLASLPVTAIMILLAARFGRLADEHGPRLYLTIGPALIGASMLVFLGLKERSDYWTFGVAGLTGLGLGLACVVAPITATALSSAPSEYSGIASGVNQTVSRLGNLVAVAVLGVVVALVFEASGGSADAVPLAVGQTGELRSASIDAFRAALIVVAGLAFAGAATAALGISNRDAREGGEAR